MAVDDGPTHGPSVSSVITEPYEVAVECNWAASPFQAVAAAIIELDPGPENIRAELTSGGNAPKSMAEPSVAYSAAAALAASVAAYEPALIPSVFTNIS